LKAIQVTVGNAAKLRYITNNLVVYIEML